MRDYKVGSGQSLKDIAVQIYGCYEGVFLIMEDNGIFLGPDQVPEPGTTIKVRDEIPDLNGVNQGIAAKFSRERNILAGGVFYEANEEPVEEPDRILDIVPGAKAAFSINRLLSNAYTGPLIRVRRSSDNAELDIDPDALGDLDQVALLAFVGANSGYLVKVYDQSGNGNDRVQATAARQMRVVSAGVVEVENGKPAALCYVMAAGLEQATPGWPTDGVDNSFFLVYCMASSNLEVIYSFDINNLMFISYPDNASTYRHATAPDNYVNGAAVTISSMQHALDILGVDTQILHSGMGFQITSAWTGVFDIFRGGSLGGTSINCCYQEEILYEADMSADRGVIEADIADYYGITI